MAQETTNVIQHPKAAEKGGGAAGHRLSDDGIGEGSKTEVIDIQEEGITQFFPETNIQYAWDATSLGDFKRCPRLYQYLYIEGWQPRKENPNLRFGGEYHRALQDYDKLKAEGIKHDEAVFHVVKGLIYRTEGWNPDNKYKNRDFLVRTVIWYLEEHKDDPAKVHILSNGKPAVELSFNFELDWGFKDQPYVLCGHIDKIVTFSDELFVMDHKTTTTTPGDYYFNQFEPDNQMTLYTLASRVCYEAPVRGVIINAAQIMVDSSRFVRGMTYRTQDQLDEWVDDLHPWLAKAEEYATKKHWPMNDTACDKYGGCKFRNICNKSPSVREKFLEANFEKGTIWNPLIPRE